MEEEEFLEEEELKLEEGKCTCTQYPDLTELKYASARTEKHIEETKTEFIFHLSAPHNYDLRKSYILDAGFQEVSCMNNWWPSHRGEKRTLTLFWMRAPNGLVEPQPCKRKAWLNYRSANEHYFHGQHLAWSGCGFKIGVPPLGEFATTRFHRFFTLMRMPVIVKPLNLKWLKKHNYRHLDTGFMASYWINGWKPKEYDIKKEYEYFGTTKEQWALEPY